MSSCMPVSHKGMKKPRRLSVWLGKWVIIMYFLHRPTRRLLIPARNVPHREYAFEIVRNQTILLYVLIQYKTNGLLHILETKRLGETFPFCHLHMFPRRDSSEY